MKKDTLHLLIVLLTIFSFSESCSFVTPTKEVPKIATDAEAQYITVSGMKYLVLITPNATQVINVTKDSLEVIVRRRNEKYLEIANRQFNHLHK